ncbi:mitochondrial import receptor subunit TOM40 homolog [Saccoglossus kowalevskii]|uniref:Mitochondrial import receptor subunit TOM40 homolog n=1 Tax=Saccoglossus kowalevskii TaxID=10224 RepID=A0ABM0GZ08_SACKO|nr:PREDICTED: mitochondrial import receptor subunit TOM40 homolog [Saccoglossus kowalevskii]
MGNVYASGNPSNPPNPSPSPPVSAIGAMPTTVTSAMATRPKDEGLPNPGTFEDLHKKVKELMPMPFEGCKLMVNKGLSNHFQVGHQLSLSADKEKSSYHFSATYVGTKQISPSESYPVILGDIDNSGNLQAQFIHQLTERIRTKALVQTQQTAFSVVQMDCEYKGPSYTATVTTANPDLINESGIIVAQYLQSITNSLSMGSQILYQYGQGQEMAEVSLTARYTGSSWVFTGALSPATCHLSYYHKGQNNVQVGVEFESRMGETVTTLGYQMDVPQANLQFKGSLDTNWRVAAVMEKKLTPMPFTFSLSAILDHTKHRFLSGFGLMIG